MRWVERSLALAAVLLLSTGARAQDAANGKTIAQVWCANCHNIGTAGQSSARDAPPSLGEIARRRSTTLASLAAFLRRPHAGMPDFNLSRAEIDDVSMYILSLRRPP